MWFIERLFALIMFPVRWFWDNFDRYKESKSIWKIILLFLGSLTGLALFAGLLGWLVGFLINNHPEWIVGGGLIIWLYAYVKSKMDKKAEVAEQSAPLLDPSIAELQAQAEKGYPIMRNIIYQTAKETAPDIGCLVPRLLKEIELPESRYILANGTCFYQFRLNKADLRMQYQIADLLEFKEQFQAVCSRLISSGCFPTLQMQSCMDAWGNWHDAVCIDVIEDVGNTFILQAVFFCPAYANYLHQLQMNQADIGAGCSLPDAQWNNKV